MDKNVFLYVKYNSCILFYVLYVTFRLFVINLIRMLFTSRAIAYSPVAYGQYNNLIM